MHNLRATPKARIDVRELPRDERDALYPRIAELAPVFAEYQSKTDRVIPIARRNVIPGREP